jgi:uncharacterized protein (DUF2225 family)
MIKESKGIRKFEFNKTDDAPIDVDSKQTSEKSSEHDEPDDDENNVNAESEFVVGSSSKLGQFMNRALGTKLSKKKLKAEQKQRIEDMKVKMVEEGKLSSEDASRFDTDKMMNQIKMSPPQPLSALHVECCDLSAW